MFTKVLTARKLYKGLASPGPTCYSTLFSTPPLRPKAGLPVSDCHVAYPLLDEAEQANAQKIALWREEVPEQDPRKDCTISAGSSGESETRSIKLWGRLVPASGLTRTGDFSGLRWEFNMVLTLDSAWPLDMGR